MKQISNCKLFSVGTPAYNFIKILKNGNFEELSAFKNSFNGRMAQLFVFNKRLKLDQIDVLYQNRRKLIYEEFFKQKEFKIF